MQTQPTLRGILPIVALMALLSATGVAVVGACAEPIRAIEQYPWLEDYFPYGFWMADGGIANKLAEALGEPYEARREKIMHDLSRHHVNALIPACRVVGPGYLNAAQRFGIRCATMPLYLYRHVDNAGNLKDKDLQWVKDQWSGHARQIKDHPALLAYHVFDEPHPTVSPKIQQITDLLTQVDPLHPAIYTHQNLPLDRDNPSWGAPEWSLLDSLNVVCSDMYSIGPEWGRDPWAYGDVGMAQFRRVDPDAVHWPIIQAFAFRAAPTIPEVRVMIFHTIACGAKGVLLFTTEQSYARWINGFYPSVGNPWFAEEPLWADISRIGRHLTSAGPLLMPRRLDPDYPVRVDTPNFRARVRTGWLREDGDLRRPAVHVGAFVGDDFDILVVHNDDPWQTRSGRVTVDGRGRCVYDLRTLRQVRTRISGDRVAFTVRFEPGDGRLYLVGDQADFAGARATVQRHLYQHESLQVGLDAGIAAKAGVEVGLVRERLHRAQLVAEARGYGAALRLAGEARRLLGQAQVTHGSYARTAAALDAAREALHRIDDWCELHADFLSGGLGDHRLKALTGQATELARQFVALENGIRAGTLNLQQAEALRLRVETLADRFIAYRPRSLQPYRIALLQLGEATEDLRHLHDWLRMVYRRVEVLRADEEGGFVGESGNARGLQAYDLLWVHAGNPGGPVAATYCGRASVAADALSLKAKTAISRFTKAGGGLILSGFATALVDDLGYDSVAPNHLYWGPLAMPGGGQVRWDNFGKSGKVLGLKPTAPDHPVFEGLPAEGFAIWDWGLSEMVGRAVWQRPSRPTRGVVLAGYYSDGADIPDEFAVVVEYTPKGTGKVIAVGDCLDPKRDRAHSTGARWGTNQDRFIRNLVAYCAL